MPRPLVAQILLDVLNDVTGTTERYGRYPEGKRSIQAELPINTRFLTLFGRSNREFLSDLEPKLEPTLTQALHIINSSYINGKLRSGNGTIAKLLKPESGEKLTPAELATELYLRTLSRYPTKAELEKAETHLVSEETTLRENTEDLLWALISSRAFLFNR